MTEAISIGIIVALFAGLLGALLGSKNKATLQDLEMHKKDLNPHTACPVHATEISFIRSTLSSIESKVDKLLEQKSSFKN